MKKLISIVLLVLICLAGFSQQKVALKCDIGTYLSVCTGCQQINGYDSPSFNSATLHGTNTREWFTRFEMRQLPNGNYTFRDEKGELMSLCTGCIARGTQQDFITFHTRKVEHFNQFQLIKLPNGKYLIKCIHNGNYVARCNACSPTSTQINQVAVHAAPGSENEAWAQWDIVYLHGDR
jgi:hypothetical protein